MNALTVTPRQAFEVARLLDRTGDWIVYADAGILTVLLSEVADGRAELGKGIVMPIEPPARPELPHAQATWAPFNEVAASLRELLGPRLTAYLGSAKETRTVNEWADSGREPAEPVQRRLRLALQVALMIAAADGMRVARAWFQGMNPQLDDRSPARLLREGDLDEVGAEVLGAARAFVVGG